MTDSVDTAKNETQTGVELTLNDLNAIKNVLEVATQRGAFKAHELTAVGQVYDKLATFLASISKQQSQNTEKGN